MVERGGLNYPIRVKDEFSKTTALFRKELRASKKEFRSFQQQLAKGKSNAKQIRETAAATKQLAQAQAALAKAARGTSKPLTEEERNLRALGEAERQLILTERERLKLAKDQEAASRRAAAATEKQERATERAAKAKRKAAERAQKERDRVDPAKRAARNVAALELETKTIRVQIGLLRQRATVLARSGDAAGAGRLVREAERLEQRLKGTNKQAGNLLFTFRRLVGTLAIFTLARKGVQLFNELVAAGIRFNDTIEASTLGVGGLVATLGDVRNELGQSVSAAEELDLALGLSRKQIELLRQDSLRTVATFSELLDTFQVAVGPGLAAGLNLDEVRQLTVQISQAAAALSVPQNQLAEEIRSLLAGTIQARTTRIATALGITNADIRRLRESGELFGFLEKRLEGFAESAQRQARQTIGGLQSLLRGAFEALVGEAAEPLFDSLIELGNDLLDNVLTITDEFGNLQPNPEAVAALQVIFDALRDGVVAAREFGESLGFEGIQQIAGAVGASLQFVLGIVKSIAITFGLAVKVVTEFRDFLGLSNKAVGQLAGTIGQVVAGIFLMNKGLGLFGTNLKGVIASARAMGLTFGVIVRNIAIVSAGILAILKVTELWFEKITGVELSIGDTAKLITQGVLSAFEDVLGITELILVRIKQIQNSPKEAAKGLLNLAGDVGLAVGDALGSELARIALEESLTEQAGVDPETGLLKEESEAERNIREGSEAVLKSIRARRTEREKNVALILAEADGEKDLSKNASEGLEAFDPDAVDTGEGVGFEGIVSTADKPIAELQTKLLELTDSLRVVRAEFAQGVGGAGLGGDLGNIFREEEVERGERVRTVSLELKKSLEAIKKLRDEGLVTDERVFEINEALKTSAEDRVEALKALNLTEEEAKFISLLTDQKDLRESLLEAQKASFDLATARAAVLAQRQIPALREQVFLLRAAAAAEQAVTAGVLAGAGPRQQRIIQARNAVALAREELIALVQRNQADLADAQRARDQAAEGSEERAALQEAVNLLQQRAAIEEDILGSKTAQLDKEREIAELFESGNALQGARQGLMELAGELPTIFEVGLNLTKQFVTSFANFAATEIVNAIVNAQQEGVDESELFKQAAGRFAQELATQILQQVIQNLIGLLLQATIGRAAAEASSATAAASIRIAGAQTAGAIEIAAATQAAAIRAASGGAGGHEGGFVQGFNAGGPVSGSSSSRPRGLHPADTIPAWLAPGEFVMRRAAVQALGLPALTAMNGGNMGVMGSGSAEAAGPAVGMQGGGLVTDSQVNANNEVAGDGEGGVVVVPAVVANDREMDQLTAGGRNAMLAFMRENSGDINTLLDRSAGRG